MNKQDTPPTKPSGVGEEKSSLNSTVEPDDVNHRWTGQRNLQGNTADAIFEILLSIEEEVTKLRIRFDKLGKVLGYKV